MLKDNKAIIIKQSVFWCTILTILIKAHNYIANLKLYIEWESNPSFCPALPGPPVIINSGASGVAVKPAVFHHNMFHFTPLVGPVLQSPAPIYLIKLSWTQFTM